MSRLKKMFKIKRGFTLMECVLAMAILAVTSAIMLPTLTASYGFISSSQSLDSITAIAERNAVSVPYSGLNTSFQTDSEGYQYAYATGFTAQVYFAVQTDGVGMTFSPHTYQMVATIVMDNRDNMVVVYDIDPSELKRIYMRK